MDIERILNSSNSERDLYRLQDQIDMFSGVIEPTTYNLVTKLHQNVKLDHMFNPLWLVDGGYQDYDKYLKDSTQQLISEHKERVRKILDIAGDGHVNGERLSIPLTPLLVILTPEEFLNKIDGLKEIEGGRILKRLFPKRYAFFPSAL